MTEVHRQNALHRREIIAAYVNVLDRLDELVTICGAHEGEREELAIAVQEAFGLSSIAADAVLALQVGRFTPGERKKLRDELAEVDLLLANSVDAESGPATSELT